MYAALMPLVGRLLDAFVIVGGNRCSVFPSGIVAVNAFFPESGRWSDSGVGFEKLGVDADP